MALKFAEAVREAEEDQLLEACRVLRVGPEDTAWIIAKHRRGPGLLDLVLVLGGGLGDFIRMNLEVRRTLMGRR